jgi:hypothetical protein
MNGIPNDIKEEYGIPEVGATQDAPATEKPLSDFYNSSDEALDNRVNSVFGAAQPQPSNQPKPEETAPNPTQTATAPDPSNQPKSENVDPVKLFAENSPKAFFNAEGGLDDGKIKDYFLTNGKSFMKYVDNPAFTNPNVAKPTAIVEKPDPVKEYNEKLDYFTKNYQTLVSERMTQGATHEQIVQETNDYYALLKGELDQKQAMRAQIDEQLKNLSPELEQSRESNITSAINRNIVELSSGLNGLINGLSGEQVLNQFVLNNQYGGKEISRLFNKDNPGADKLTPEEHSKLTAKWFRGFQSDIGEMARVAEYGRLKWQVENMKEVFAYSQQIGAQKVKSQMEAGMGAVSSINSQTPQAAENGPLAKFFGTADSVN